MSVDGDEAVVAGDDLRARVPVADSAPPSLKGAIVSVRVPKELPELSPGYVTVISDASDDSTAPFTGVLERHQHGCAGARRRGHGPAQRLRVSVPAQGRRSPIPPRPLRRGGVFVRADVFSGLGATLDEIATSLGPGLRPQTPAFTCEHTSGVGLAEDDSGPDSFGTERCRCRGGDRQHARCGSTAARVVRGDALRGRRCAIDAPSAPQLSPPAMSF